MRFVLFSVILEKRWNKFRYVRIFLYICTVFLSFYNKLVMSMAIYLANVSSGFCYCETQAY